MYDCLKSDCTPREKRYQTNHCYVEVGGFGIAAFTLRTEYPELSQNYTDLAYEHFSDVLTYINIDGVSPEGQSYWAYGMSMLLMYFDAEKQFYGVDRVIENDYFLRTIDYRLFTTTPGFENPVFFGDVYLSRNDVYVSYRLASKRRNSYLQWVAEKAEPIVNQRASVSAVVWADNTLESTNPQNTLPLFKYYEDSGILSVKSSWEIFDDQPNIMVNFKANPPCGKKIEEQAGKNGVNVCGHKHPDCGGFHVFMNGKLLVLDDGYTYYKRTIDHNLVTFDGGKGQYGENSKWFEDSLYISEFGDCRTIHQSTITDEGNNVIHYIVANLTRMYPYSLGMKKFLRHFVVVKSKYIIVMDDIETNSPKWIDSHFHAPVSGNIDIRSDNVLYTSSEGRNFKLFVINGSQSISSGYHSNTASLNYAFYSTIINVTAKSSKKELIRTVLIPYNSTEPNITVVDGNNGYYNSIEFDDGTIVKIDLETFDVSTNSILYESSSKRNEIMFLSFFFIIIITCFVELVL